MSKVTLSLECEDVDVAHYLLMLWDLYEHGDRAEWMSLRDLPNALEYLRDQLAEITDENGDLVDYHTIDGKEVAVTEHKFNRPTVKSFLNI